MKCTRCEHCGKEAVATIGIYEGKTKTETKGTFCNDCFDILLKGYGKASRGELDKKRR